MDGIESYAAPRSLEEALGVLRGGDATVLAGGTDLMPQTAAGRIRFKPTLLNISRLAELRGISESNGQVRIGALATVTELLESDLVRAKLRVLWEACDHFASDQIRNAATVGGNICNASPAGDMLVPLLVLEARVVLAGKPNGPLETRKIALAAFLTGPGKTMRAAHELVTGVEVPAPPAGFVSAYFKSGTRPALDISAVAIGLGAVREKKSLRKVRLAFGAVAPTPVRAPKTEALLEDKPLDDALIETAAAAVQAEIHPISDVRASDWYRRELAANMLKRMLVHVREG
jgi:CO/xanthine dehydrogenase FAD-binding subunit